jgi:hypothetical protein
MYYLRRTRFASPLPLDLVLIDGPPAVLGGREGTLYQALEFARPGTIVLLDDANRSEEQAALSGWRTVLEVSLLPGFRKGMAAIVVRQPIPVADLRDYHVRLITCELATQIPPSSTFILIDEDRFGWRSTADYRVLPLLEQDGHASDRPADDDSAVEAVKRLSRAGARFLVLAWPAFWWLDCYPGFSQYLRANFRCVLRNDRLLVFDLTTAAAVP